MDPLDLVFATTYGHQRRRERYDKRNAARRRRRLERNQVIYPDLIKGIQDQKAGFGQQTTAIYEDDGEDIFNDYCEHNNDSDNRQIVFTFEQQEEDNDYKMDNMFLDVYCDSASIEQTQSDDDHLTPPVKLHLHNYTSTLVHDYCETFTMLARHANLSKTHTNDFLSFIKSGLPVPNNMPSSEKELLYMLDVEDLFTKRSICILCYCDFDYEQKMCSQCHSSDKNSIAYVYDTNVETIIRKIITRLSFSVDEYKRKININDDEEKTKDIPFGTLYQELLKKNDYKDMISMLLHLDGVSVTKSSKLKMWMFSGCILELPPKLRNRRCNMVLISIWVGYVGPRSELWLKRSVNTMEIIKRQGIDILDKNHKLMIFGITGDCPALSLVCNFINHNGYFSCWYCFIKGQHINHKRQYRYGSIALRKTEQFSKASNKAERTKANVYGHLGKTILENILDVPLPKAIVLDYLHVTLLGHAKAIVLSIYHQMKPAQREQFNIQLKNQKFPHFFHRKIRTMDSFAFVKGTEVRNLLFYGLLPHLKPFLPIEQYAHLSLYVCAIRLLHSGHVFGDKTSRIAHRLFSTFYKDHELFYTELQSFKLHLHIHYASVYESHGSLSNLGCFGQESFIGSVSANYHGTRYYGNSITYYYNIDFSMQNKKQERTITNGPHDMSSTLANDYEHVKQFHAGLCNCVEMNICCTIYRRFIIRNEMFHSLIYHKRQSSVSYFVEYSLDNDVQDNRFGVIELFFTFNKFGYAVIKYHRVKELCSDIFKNSHYYHLLQTTINSLYFILEKDHCEIDIVPTDYIYNHCIVVEKNDYLFVTTISSYSEHD